MVQLKAIMGVLLLSSVALAATLKYNSVDININTNMSDGKLGASASASPVLGVRNAVVRGGVAFTGLTQDMGSYSATLSTKVPANLHLNLKQGSLNGNLTGVPLRALDMSTDQTDVVLTLPGGGYTGKLVTSQGSVRLNFPAGVGVQVSLQKFEMGSLTINGQKVVDSLSTTGTFSTPNYGTAKSKVQLFLTSNQTEVVINGY